MGFAKAHKQVFTSFELTRHQKFDILIFWSVSVIGLGFRLFVLVEQSIQ